MASAHDYGEAIIETLTAPRAANYEALGKLRWLYFELHSTERGKMEDGLAIAIKELMRSNTIGPLANGIHLAYQLDMDGFLMDDAIQEVRRSDFYVDDRVRREVNNFMARSSNLVS